MSDNLPRRVLGACAILLVLALMLAPLPVAAQEPSGDMTPPPGPPADMVPEQPVADEMISTDVESVEPAPPDGVETPVDEAQPAEEIGFEDKDGTSCLKPTKDIGSDRSTYADNKQGVVGGVLKIGGYSGRDTIALVHFNPAASIPTNSTINAATLKLSQTGGEVGGSININAYRANKGWSGSVSYGTALGMFGSQFSSATAGTGSATINFNNAKTVAAEWLQQGAGNNGAIFRGSTSGIHNFSSHATLHVEYTCDKQAPTSVMQNFSKTWHKADFGVSWRGSDPVMTNAPPPASKSSMSSTAPTTRTGPNTVTQPAGALARPVRKRRIRNSTIAATICPKAPRSTSVSPGTTVPATRRRIPVRASRHAWTGPRPPSPSRRLIRIRLVRASTSSGPPMTTCQVCPAAASTADQRRRGPLRRERLPGMATSSPIP
ncbi:MAG: DNRLRE domain-containing protein [Anaerolineales bacterium]|nr:DNRLRE domain-containing protein [Anaerolineales bacterium]